MKRRIGWLDDLRVEEVAGSHHVHLEHPTLVAELVQPFLQSEN
jgi:pimeloyl-ACP methyl ester carboxylesterase